MLTLPAPIVDAAWLGERLDRPDLRIADVRWSLVGPHGREAYAAGHLPGAVFLDLDTDLSSPGNGPGRHPIPAPDALSRALGRAGIGDEHVVIAYDDAGGSVASRLWWLYRHFGHEGRCAVLDGGIRAWTDAGLPLTVEPPAHRPTRWTAHPPRHDTVTADEVAALSDGATLLDARAPERYRGETEPIDPRAGHIPGARSAPWSGNLRSDGRFRSPEELRARYAELGAEGRPTVAYCGSGVNATHDLLALELAAIDGARLYAGSWSDWSSDPERPIVTGPNP
jgi:thiosulfate/3-mercaptopyruvate sulfurtransferase